MFKGSGRIYGGPRLILLVSMNFIFLHVFKITVEYKVYLMNNLGSFKVVYRGVRVWMVVIESKILVS